MTQKIAELCKERQARPDALPPDEENLAGLIAALARGCGGLEVELPPSPAPNQKFPYSLVVRRPDSEGRLAVRVLVNASATSTTAALRRLARDDEPPECVLLATEERRPLTFGVQPDAMGRQYYDELLERGDGQFRPIQLTLDEYIQLDALQAVIGMAKSGDLEIELPGGGSQPVSQQEVIESHRRQKRCQALPVLRELFDAAHGEREASAH